jgi:hypothetical protein
VKRAAKHLGLSVKTVQRYRDSGTAPRAVLLALFYESTWGYSLLHTTAYNRQMWLGQQVGALQRQNAVLAARVALLERLGDFGAANEPLSHPPRPERADDLLFRGPRGAVTRG